MFELTKAEKENWLHQRTPGQILQTQQEKLNIPFSDPVDKWNSTGVGLPRRSSLER